MKSKKPDLNLLPIDEEHVLLFALRYAIGRRTAAPGIVVRQITEKWDQIRDWTQVQMKEEVQRAIDRGEIDEVSRLNEWSKLFKLVNKPPPQY